MNYIRQQGLRTNPKAMFRDDLLSALRIWRSNGKRVILMMDANEHVSDGKMCSQLRQSDIDMHPSVDSMTPRTSPKTWFRGKEAIDDIWFSSDLEVIAASYLPFHGDIGDHRPVIADATIQSILGTNLPKIIPPAARQLNSKVDCIRIPYTEKLEALFKEHNIYDRLQALAKKAAHPGSADDRRALEVLDNQMEQFMLSSEKGCRKIRVGHYEFSPAVKSYLDRCHALKWLLRHRCKINRGIATKINTANMKRFAKRNDIENPLALSTSVLAEMYKLEKERTRRVLADLACMRTECLNSKLQHAINAEKDEDVTRLEILIKNERKKKTWRGIQYVTKPNRGGWPHESYHTLQ